MFPVIRPEKIDDSKSIWCSGDRAKAWLDLALRKKAPASAACDNPVESIVALGQALGVRATPTVFFENGERKEGGLSAPDLRNRIEVAARETRQAKAK
jgi:thiol:disulfide interchange protein DsbC